MGLGIIGWLVIGIVAAVLLVAAVFAAGAGWSRARGQRLIDIIVSTLPAGSTLAPGRIAAAKRHAFLAILAEEEPRLTAIPGTIETIRGEIG